MQEHVGVKGLEGGMGENRAVCSAPNKREGGIGNTGEKMLVPVM